MKQYGDWRVYFNRHGAAPLMWCVSPLDGAWEIAVQRVMICAASKTDYEPKPTADEDDGKPSAWISVTGWLDICETGYALIGDETP